jgi:hypothetical protein
MPTFIEAIASCTVLGSLLLRTGDVLFLPALACTSATVLALPAAAAALLLGLTGWPLLAWSFGSWASCSIGLTPAGSSTQQQRQADKEGNQRSMRAWYISR